MSLIDTTNSRKLVYGLLICLAAGGVAGHILSATRVYDPQVVKDPSDPNDPRGPWPAQRPQPMPTFGSNDISRWATVRALVDEGTYVIGRHDPDSKVDTGIIAKDGWKTKDKVLHPETHEFYSSKPPLLPTLVAGLYLLLQALTGWTLEMHPFSVVRTILLLINLLPFLVYLVLLARLLDRGGPTDWGRFFLLATAAFATLVTPFLVTFNNHTVATFCVLFALYPVMPWLRFPWDRSPVRPSRLALAGSGLFAGLTACVELPATAFAVLLGCLLWFQSRRATLVYFLPALLLPILAQLFLNYVAIGNVNYAYSKKFTDDQWYEYSGSPWKKPNVVSRTHSLDFAAMQETRADYAFHMLLGHHGLFSLTPIWLFVLAGMIWALVTLRERWDQMRQTGPAPGPDWSALACMTLVLTAVTLAFYLILTDNYGGGTSGMRWLMWLTPLWLLTMLPVVDWLGARRWGRWLALVLLAWSVMSASYPTWNPWRHPWLYNLLDSAGYVPY